MERKLLLSKQNKHMDKKKYIRPEMEEMLVESQQMMVASPGTKPGMSSGPADGSDGLSNHRRGTWGNLWAEE